MSKKDDLRAKKLMKRFNRYYIDRNKYKMGHIFSIITKFIKNEV